MSNVLKADEGGEKIPRFRWRGRDAVGRGSNKGQEMGNMRFLLFPAGPGCGHQGPGDPLSSVLLRVLPHSLTHLPKRLHWVLF